MRKLVKYADSEGDASLGNQLRRKRFEYFKSLVDQVPKPVKILDVGGTQNFWKQMGMLDEDGFEYTLINLEAEVPISPKFDCQAGDARDLSRFADKQFDIVFSNSVIEHVGTLEDQRKMAKECMRVGKRFYIQTPTRFFPIEPHFLFPFFQFMPLGMKVWLLMHFKLGWFEKMTDRDEAVAAAKSARLMTRRELVDAFPGATVYVEKFKGLAKSFTMIGGWEPKP